MINRKILCELGYEDLIVFENPDYDSAIIGVTDDDRVVYDYDKMVVFLTENENMSTEEAVDFISYNTLRTIPYIGNCAPVVMYAF